MPEEDPPSPNRGRVEPAATGTRRGDGMIRRKSSQFQSLRTPSELEQSSQLRRENKKDRSSVDDLTSRVGLGVWSERCTITSVEDEDSTANLFPVRTSSPLVNVIKGLRPGRHPSLSLLTLRRLLAALVKRRMDCSYVH